MDVSVQNRGTAVVCPGHLADSLHSRSALSSQTEPSSLGSLLNSFNYFGRIQGQCLGPIQELDEIKPLLRILHLPDGWLAFAKPSRQFRLRESERFPGFSQDCRKVLPFLPVYKCSSTAQFEFNVESKGYSLLE